MTQGLQTLRYGAALLNPFRYGAFAFALFSHKLARWLVYLAVPFGFVGIVWLSIASTPALYCLVAILAGIAMACAAIRWPSIRKVPWPFAIAGFAMASIAGGLIAWIYAFRGQRLPMWEPTRRAAIPE